MEPIISKYRKDANLELEIEIYGWRCSYISKFGDVNIGSPNMEMEMKNGWSAFFFCPNIQI